MHITVARDVTLFSTYIQIKANVILTLLKIG